MILLGVRFKNDDEWFPHRYLAGHCGVLLSCQAVGENGNQVAFVSVNKLLVCVAIKEIEMMDGINQFEK